MCKISTKKIAFTSNLKEAYTFAKLLNVTDGIKGVKVKRTIDAEYQISFWKSDDDKEIADMIEEIITVYDLNGLEFHKKKN